MLFYSSSKVLFEFKKKFFSSSSSRSSSAKYSSSFEFAALVLTEGIKQEIVNSWHKIKVDGTKDPTGEENISTVIRFFNEHSLKVVERVLVLSSTDSGDVKSITDVILAELRSILAPLTFGLCPTTSFAMATALARGPELSYKIQDYVNHRSTSKQKALVGQNTN